MTISKCVIRRKRESTAPAPKLVNFKFFVGITSLQENVRNCDLYRHRNHAFWSLQIKTKLEP